MALQVGKQGSKALLKAVRDLIKTDVLVGFPSGGVPREDGSPLTNAAIAYIQDKGAPEANIPARPFMEPGIRAAQEAITKRLAQAAKAAVAGDAAGIQAGQQGAGLAGVAAIRNLIQDGIDPPLAAKTLAARKREGFQGETPLLRSGELREGVKWVIAPKQRG